MTITAPVCIDRTVSILRAPLFEESLDVIQYQGYSFQLVQMPDDTASDGLSDYSIYSSLTPEQVESWERDWDFFNVLVHAVDANGDWIDIDGFVNGRGDGPYPSFMEQSKVNDILYSMCDELIDELDSLAY